MMKMMRKRKNRILAIVAEPRARPVKPKTTRDDRDQTRKSTPISSMYAPVLGQARHSAADAPTREDAEERMLQELPVAAKGETAESC